MSDADVTRSSAILQKSQFAGIGFQTVEKAVRPQGKREISTNNKKTSI
jgi:hypothetical protein